MRIGRFNLPKEMTARIIGNAFGQIIGRMAAAALEYYLFK